MAFVFMSLGSNIVKFVVMGKISKKYPNSASLTQLNIDKVDKKVSVHGSYNAGANGQK
jgi:hypothetical protein